MKNVVLKNSKKFAKIEKKLFTEKERNSKIKKDYNPLKVNYKIYRRGNGLYMENDQLKEIRNVLNWKERILINIFPKTIIKIYKKGIEKGFNSSL